MGDRRFFVGGNWKLNGDLQFIRVQLGALNAQQFNPDIVDVVVAPPAVYISAVNLFASTPIGISAQNCSVETSGAFTGELSAKMLHEVGARYVILGHSERRHVFGECDELIALKTSVALAAGLSVIACVGEKEEERDNNQTLEVITRQLVAFSKSVSDWRQIVIAYEPVWAIGTGKTASPEQAQEVHEQIRDWLRKNVSDEVAANVRIIYGGSVKESNCRELAIKPDVDGFLVGGASLVASDFIKIINANNVKAAL